MVVLNGEEREGSAARLASEAKVEAVTCEFGVIKLLRQANSRVYYCFPKGGGFVYRRPVGAGSPEEAKRGIFSTITDEAWKCGTRILSDLRWAAFSLNFAQMYKLAASIDDFMERFQAKSGLSAIVTDKDFEFGLSRMYENLTQKSHLKVFCARTIEPAVEFLGIDPVIIRNIIAEIDRLESAS